jgi:erythromycin esterase
VNGADVVAEIRSLASSLTGTDDLDPPVERVAAALFVCIGEASHGSHEYYRWWALLSRRLIEEHGFTWIGVEGDWPKCWRINRWVRGRATSTSICTACSPASNGGRPGCGPIRTWPRSSPGCRSGTSPGPHENALGSMAWTCTRYARSSRGSKPTHPMLCRTRCGPGGASASTENPREYARSTRPVPETCEADVVALLVEVRRRAPEGADDEEGFDAAQTAEVAADAEHYYRIRVRAFRES